MSDDTEKRQHVSAINFITVKTMHQGRIDQLACSVIDGDCVLFVRNSQGTWDRVREVKVIGLEGWKP